MRISSLSVLFIMMYVVGIALRTSALREYYRKTEAEICIYKNRQLTVGQTYIDCYNKVTCRAKGVTEISKSCRSYSCRRASMWRGYKAFDASKPYPDCCGGSICADGRIVYHSIPIPTN